MRWGYDRRKTISSHANQLVMASRYSCSKPMVSTERCNMSQLTWNSQHNHGHISRTSDFSARRQGVARQVLRPYPLWSYFSGVKLRLECTRTNRVPFNNLKVSSSASTNVDRVEAVVIQTLFYHTVKSEKLWIGTISECIHFRFD